MSVIKKTDSICLLLLLLFQRVPFPSHNIRDCNSKRIMFCYFVSSSLSSGYRAMGLAWEILFKIQSILLKYLNFILDNEWDEQNNKQTIF